MQADIPEVVHLQPDGPLPVLFVRIPLDRDRVLNLRSPILSPEWGFLGRGF